MGWRGLAENRFFDIVHVVEPQGRHVKEITAKEIPNIRSVASILTAAMETTNSSSEAAKATKMVPTKVRPRPVATAI